MKTRSPRGRRRPSSKPHGRTPIASSLPDDFARAASDWLGDEVSSFLAACARPPHLAVRANRLKGGLTALRAALDGDAVWPSVPWWPEALLPPPDDGARLAASLLARVGALYAQDPAALAAVAALDPRPGERVLDLCAAPGGKSTAIADRLGPSGLLVANDVDPSRARELARTIERWGVANCAVASLAPDRLAILAPALFDSVLVDAPCSGEAMFARHDRAAADWSPGHVRGCAARQQGLLEAARRIVRLGGRIIYSTCTFNPTENEGVVVAYLAAHPDDALDDAHESIPVAAPGRPDLLPAGLHRPELARCARLWPHKTPGAGHFIARIHVADAPSPPSRVQRHKRAPLPPLVAGEGEQDVAFVRAAVDLVAPRLDLSGHVVVRGDRAFLEPDGLPAALIAAAFIPGLALAERRGRTWRPAHALAMTLQPGQAATTRDLTDDEVALFLSGHPIDDVAAADRRAVLACWRGYPLGWARAQRGSLAPQLPKGLLTPHHTRQPA